MAGWLFFTVSQVVFTSLTLGALKRTGAIQYGSRSVLSRDALLYDLLLDAFNDNDQFILPFSWFSSHDRNQVLGGPHRYHAGICSVSCLEVGTGMLAGAITA